jgi:hypothetical protein
MTTLCNILLINIMECVISIDDVWRLIIWLYVSISKLIGVDTDLSLAMLNFFIRSFVYLA